MSKAEILAELPKLSPGELREVLDRLLELHDGWLDDGELTQEEKALIEDRLAEHAANPELAIPWEQVKARLVQRYGQ